MEQKQNWRKFQSWLGFTAPKKQGLSVLMSDGKIIGGALAKKEKNNYFTESEYSPADQDAAADFLLHKYQAEGLTIIDREELLQQLQSISIGKLQRTPSYLAQLEHLRSAFGVGSPERTKKTMHLGEKNPEQFWPKQHFFLEIFDTMFAELLPEKKILLFGVTSQNQNEFSCLALEFQGRKIKNFSDLDWTSLD